MPIVPVNRRVVEVLSYDGRGWDAGSGYLLHPQCVLTAAHNVDDAREVLVRLHGAGPAPEEHPAVVRRSGGARLDLALLEVPGLSDASPPPRYGVIDRDEATQVEDCLAIGYPAYKERSPAAGGRPRRWSGQIGDRTRVAADAPIRDLAWIPGEQLATGEQDGDSAAVRLWTSTGRLIGVLKPNAEVSRMRCGPGGALAALAGNGRDILLWRQLGGPAAATVLRHHADVAEIAWSPAGELATSAVPEEGGTTSGLVTVWSGAGQKLCRLAYDDPVDALAWTTDGDLRVVAGAGLHLLPAPFDWPALAAQADARRLPALSAEERYEAFLPPGRHVDVNSAEADDSSRTRYP